MTSLTFLPMFPTFNVQTSLTFETNFPEKVLVSFAWSHKFKVLLLLTNDNPVLELYSQNLYSCTDSQVNLDESTQIPISLLH